MIVATHGYYSISVVNSTYAITRNQNFGQNASAFFTPFQAYLTCKPKLKEIKQFKQSFIVPLSAYTSEVPAYMEF